jgi:anti-sigma28 factor (negative regulator of flagellin synthesis)
MWISDEQRTMRVNDPNLTGVNTAPTGGSHETQRAGRTAAGSAASTAHGDRVELSGAVGTISRAMAADSGGRAARVRELAAQYQTGQYRHDAAATSRAMIADAIAPAMA